MNKPAPYKPTQAQMQAQAQAKLQTQQQAYLNAAQLQAHNQLALQQQAQMAQQAGGVQNVGHWSSNQAPSCGPAGATHLTYVGAGGTTYHAFQTTNGTLYPVAVQGTSGGGVVVVGGVATSARAVECRPAIDIEECGVKAGEIIAYRAWCLVGDSFMLHSMFIDYEWKPNEIQKIYEETLGPYGGNGFHAFKTLEKCQHEYHGLGTVYGEVALWGEVIEHEQGYRAECARVTRILEVHENAVGNGLRWMFGTRTIDKLRQLYGVKE